ncbi:MAG TPA: ribosome assembly factor SBDS [Candidatus Norongarragalinales archaeon]|jgi:ribosome maturation protein SDO1|nr:ribosome assembly factor SBDS [Candidatus Norongarragalinales archaeon]
MSAIQNTIIARYEKAGEKFEILVDPKLAYDYKTGVKKDLNNVLVFEEVFKDANKGDRQTTAAIQKAFHTTDIMEVAKQIFAHGELQLTTEQRRKALEEKRLKLVALIARNAIDPRAKTPHPPQRIEAALESARFHVDAFKPAEEQMNAAIEAIREIIPISLEKIKIAVKIPAEFAAKAYGALKEYGISKEEWLNDGSLACIVEMPAGIQGEFYDRLNKMTGGQVQTKQL